MIHNQIQYVAVWLRIPTPRYQCKTTIQFTFQEWRHYLSVDLKKKKKTNLAESIEFAFHVKGFFTCTGEHYSPYHLLKLPQFPFVPVCFQGWTGWIFKLLLFAPIQSNCLTPKWLLESIQNCFCHTTLTEINAGFKLFFKYDHGVMKPGSQFGMKNNASKKVV